MEEKALSLTILVGFFFLIGIAIPKFFKNKQKLILFTTGLTFIIMIYLIIFDLLPEIIEVLQPFQHLYYLLLIVIFILLGFYALKILDLFIPEHNHNHHEKNDDIKKHNAHLFHIGFITAISLILHNMLEGISIYITGLNNFKLGLIMAISVGCHNLPLGIEAAIGIDSQKEKKVQKIAIYILLIFSSFIGAFLLFLFRTELNSILEGMLLSMTVGMLAYISTRELFSEIKINRQKKEIQSGLIIGIILAFILYLL